MSARFYISVLTILAGISGFCEFSFAQQAAPAASVPAAATPAAASPCDTNAPAAAKTNEVKTEDPCAAYAGSPDAHVVCLDQLKKIQRMMDTPSQKENPPAASSVKTELSPTTSPQTSSTAAPASNTAPAPAANPAPAPQTSAAPASAPARNGETEHESAHGAEHRD